jgi:hypothetical protein
MWWWWWWLFLVFVGALGIGVVYSNQIMAHVEFWFVVGIPYGIAYCLFSIKETFGTICDLCCGKKRFVIINKR